MCKNKFTQFFFYIIFLCDVYFLILWCSTEFFVSCAYNFGLCILGFKFNICTLSRRNPQYAHIYPKKKIEKSQNFYWKRMRTHKIIYSSENSVLCVFGKNPGKKYDFSTITNFLSFLFSQKLLFFNRWIFLYFFYVLFFFCRSYFCSDRFYKKLCLSHGNWSFWILFMHNFLHNFCLFCIFNIN